MTSAGSRAAVAALMLALMGGTGAGPAHAASSAADRALDRVQRLARGEGVVTGRELSAALLDLRRTRGELRGRSRDDAARYFARPTDAGEDPAFRYAVAEAPPVCTASFCVHYVTTTDDAPDLADGDDAGTVPDYVELVAKVFEDEVRPCESGTSATACGLDATGANGSRPGQGWPAPLADGALGGGTDKMDVYIKDTGAQGLYGAVIPDLDDGPAAQTAWQLMDDDFSPAQFDEGKSGTEALRVTAAHEYHHAIQFGLDANLDPWMFESTATAMEDVVYPGIDDYLRYLASWTTGDAQALPLARAAQTPPEADDKRYASAVWNQWLAARYGHDVVRRAWEVADAPDGGRLADFAAGAYDQAIAERGGGGFAAEFARFAAAQAEWRLASAGFPDLFPDMARDGVLTVDGAGADVTGVDHTTWSLLDVQGARGSVTLHATAPPGTSAAIALVGRTGDDIGGTATTVLTLLPTGGGGSVTLPDAGSFARVTAVLVNGDTTVTGGARGEWTYARDDATFGAAVITTPGPAATAPTPAASTPPPAPAPAPQATPAADTTAPGVRVRLSRARLRSVLERGLSVPVTCDEACAITATLSLRSADARRLRLRGAIGRANGVLTRKGTRGLRIRLSRTKRRKLARRQRVTLVLTVTVVDVSGNARTVKRTLNVRR